MQFIRASLSIFEQDVFITALSFFSSVITARWLGPEQLGLLFIVMLIPSYSEKFGRIGNFDAAGVYYIKTKRHSLSDVVSHLTYISVLSALVPVAVYAALAGVFRTYVVKDANIPPSYIWTAVLTLPLTVLLISYNKIFIGEGQVRTLNTVQIMKSALSFIGIIIFYFLGWNYFGVVIASLIAYAITVGYGLYKMYRLTPITLQFKPQLVKDLFQYGWKIYFLTIVNSIHLRIDLLMAAIFLKPAQVSFYGMAVTIAQMIWKIPNAVSIVLFPRVAGQKPEEAAEFTARICRMSFFVLLVIGVVIVALSVPLVHVFYGQRFQPIVLPLALLMPGILTMSVGRLLTEHYYGQGHPRALVFASVVSAPLNILINWYMIPRYGIAGAAITSSLTYTFFTAWLILEFSKRWGKGFRDLLIPTADDIAFAKSRFNKSELWNYLRPG